MKLEQMLELPFEEYITECWKHAIRKDPNKIVIGHLFDLRDAVEGFWAKRYWFYKNGVKNDI